MAEPIRAAPSSGVSATSAAPAETATKNATKCDEPRKRGFTFAPGGTASAGRCSAVITFSMYVRREPCVTAVSAREKSAARQHHLVAPELQAPRRSPFSVSVLVPPVDGGAVSPFGAAARAARRERRLRR